MNLFADDVLLYHIISQAADYTTLQMAISMIGGWSIANFLDFNISKCKYMVISRKLQPSLPSRGLYLNGKQLQKVDSYKYLGLIVQQSILVTTHILCVQQS